MSRCEARPLGGRHLGPLNMCVIVMVIALFHYVIFADAVCQASARVTALVSANPYSVLGVTPGLISDDVIRLLRANHPVITMKACLSDYLAAKKSAVPVELPGGHCIGSISFSNPDGNGAVSFDEDKDKSAHRMVVSEIYLNFDTTSKARSQALTNAVLHSLGRPTCTDGKAPWTVAMWTHSPCVSVERESSSPQAVKYLILQKDIGVVLIDPALHRRLTANLNRSLLNAHISLKD